MKTGILNFTLIFFALGWNVNAQQNMRIGYVDMDYILQNVPEYQEASAQLDARVEEWKTEAEEKLRKVETMKKELNNERALLTNELIEERKEEIAFEEANAREYQQNRFGPNGDYLIQKKQLIRPIQDQVFTAVQEIAKNRNLDFVFDQTSETGMIYANKQFDVSDQVLRSINRSSNRTQLNSRDEIKQLEREEERTVEQDAEVSERQKAIEERKNEREAHIEERKKQRDSIREARKKEFEERRARILEERQQKRDSVAKAREQNNN